jgi:Short C-terminal domain/Bacterial PH domain
MAEHRFNAPPGWPVAPGWRPPEGWTTPADWPAAPEGWEWWPAVEPELAVDPDALWQAQGQPLKGFGGGRYKLTLHYLFFEKGTLSTNAQQVPISAVMDVDVTQTMTQKARKVGSIRVHIQRPNGIEIVNLEDIPSFREGQQIINRVAHEARLAVQQRTNTMHYTSQAAPVPQAATQPAATAAAPLPDPMAQLRSLGELRDAGILTPDEFDAKKTEILSRM